MKIFNASITYQVAEFLIENLNTISYFEIANQKMHDKFGIVNFFDNNEELERLKDVLLIKNIVVEEPNRAEYGDYQTNSELANNVTLFLVSKKISPEVIIEPTCGKGNLIIASLRNFNKIKNIFGIEIYKPYIWETKFKILDFFLSNPNINRPEITLIHSNVFEFNFNAIAESYLKNEILVIGNPPWVTNSKLGSLSSSNLPKKENLNNHNGIDAITGKGNFDIAEFITLTMIETFQNMKGNLLFLVKNSVIKNIVFYQNKNHYNISTIEKYNIDSKKEFNVSVEAALFYCKLNSNPSFDCIEFDFYNNQKPQIKFGWLNDKFVSNIYTYFPTKNIDGICPFVWRQGLKHDCSSIMELDKINGQFVNGLKEEIKLENDLIYGILKSSDLKNKVINQTRKFTIVTQNRIGQDTKYIKTKYPLTYEYLINHKGSFDSRKSSIYNNKPLFSIFGIGDYSFKPFKVAISGLYKTFHFTLVLPQNNKPIMLDDTCYMLSFDNLEFAVYSLILLNSETTMQFLKSITFADAKRTFTKDVLMRIDLLELAKQIDKTYLKIELQNFNEKYKFNLTIDLWKLFIKEMMPVKNRQLDLFA